MFSFLHLWSNRGENRFSCCMNAPMLAARLCAVFPATAHSVAKWQKCVPESAELTTGNVLITPTSNLKTYHKLCCIVQTSAGIFIKHLSITRRNPVCWKYMDANYEHRLGRPGSWFYWGAGKGYEPGGSERLENFDYTLWGYNRISAKFTGTICLIRPIVVPAPRTFTYAIRSIHASRIILETQ